MEVATGEVPAPHSSSEPIPGRLRCCVVVMATRLGLVAFGCRRIVKFVDAIYPQVPEVGTINLALAREVSVQVARVSAFVPVRAICLEQSLASVVLLRRIGIPAKLRLGVQVYPFYAHAWVECGDQPINEPPELMRALVPLSVPWE